MGPLSLSERLTFLLEYHGIDKDSRGLLTDLKELENTVENIAHVLWDKENEGLGAQEKLQVIEFYMSPEG